ncbi:hypothetical protein [Edaphobacter modestus]|uniref:T4 beta protein n=1 Tax=Edaphobacter modestus TaxID=388466 RepID=A0A4Q7XXE1_9BACT|nr:hypothetical protein [Edaphobacter modestus]RZU28960.1 hypothetical protein BDD14_6546 [Edaphobacter modestus]
MSKITAFASGVNEAREIRGFALAGIPIGASASNLRETAIKDLEEMQGPVFLDSGAFSEVSYSPDTKQLELTKPITPKEWRRRLAIYLRLAHALGSNLSVVAPDRVGDQEETLRRLAQYRQELKQLAELGVHILIPLQLGRRTHEEFYAAAKEAAGVPLVPAFTMKKAATSLSDAERFLASVRPARVHLLGMGLVNKRADEVLAMIRRTSPATAITMDSNRIRAVTGKSRRMTATEQAFRDTNPENLFNEVESPVLAASNYRLDYTESISSPSQWASNALLREIAFSSGFDLSEMHAFFGDPDGFLCRSLPGTDTCYWENPVVAHAVDRAWASYVKCEVHAHVRTAAIRHTFHTEAA